MVHLVYDSAHWLLGQEDFISDRDKVDGKSLCNCVLRTRIELGLSGIWSCLGTEVLGQRMMILATQ